VTLTDSGKMNTIRFINVEEHKMTFKTSIKIIVGTSVLMFAGATSAYADHHKSGEHGAAQMKCAEGEECAAMKEKMMKMSAEEKAAKKEKMMKMSDEERAAYKEKMSHKMKAKEKAMKHKMEAKEHKMDAMEHKMEAKERAMEAKEHGMEAKEHAMEAKEHGMEHKAMQGDAAAPAMPEAAEEPMEILSFEDALATCRANASANLQACIDKRTGQGALRKQIHGGMTN
jgi:hypothetical protein